MEYRTLPHGGEKISIIALGSGSITGTEQEMIAIIEYALDRPAIWEKVVGLLLVQHRWMHESNPLPQVPCMTLAALQI